VTAGAQQPLELEHPDAAEQRFEHELDRLLEPRIGDDPVTVARRAALANIIERARAAFANRGRR
jgi:hypothetical protein